MADPNHYDVTGQVKALKPSTGGNEPKSSHNPVPAAGDTSTPGFVAVGRTGC